MAGITHFLAGMPSLRLTDVGEMRLQTISFFIVVFLVSSLVVQRLWNGLGRDFTTLPRLTYRRSLAMVGLWGLLFILVLTMISGARELMTPGAWEPKPNALTYQLKSNAASDQLLSRRVKLTALRNALWDYAAKHGGALPGSRDDGDIGESVWQTPEISGALYVYVAGRRVREGQAMVAYEPPVFGPPLLGLFSDGTIRELTQADTGGAR